MEISHQQTEKTALWEWEWDFLHLGWSQMDSTHLPAQSRPSPHPREHWLAPVMVLHTRSTQQPQDLGSPVTDEAARPREVKDLAWHHTASEGSFWTWTWNFRIQPYPDSAVHSPQLQCGCRHSAPTLSDWLVCLFVCFYKVRIFLNV